MKFKRSNFYIANIVKKTDIEYSIPITYILPNNEQKQIIKENAILYKLDGRYIDVDEIESNFDLFCAQFFNEYINLDYFNYLYENPNKADDSYVDITTLRRLYPKQNQSETKKTVNIKELKKYINKF